MSRKTASTVIVSLLILFIVPAFAFASGVSLNLNTDYARAGTSVTASGQAISNTWVSIKVVDEEGAIILFDAVKASDSGTYNCTFVVPSVFVGTVLDVIAGYGNNTASQTLSINKRSGGSGSGGGSSVSKVVSSTNGKASVSPGHGGNISLGSDAAVEIPAGALKGSSIVEVKVKKLTSSPAVPAGSRLASDVFDFSVGSQKKYDFAKSVTIKLNFDQSLLKANEIPEICYYDDSMSKWISIGGTVSGSTISVQVEHFSKFAVLAAPVKFSDIEGNWAAADINKMYASGIIGGYPDGTFRPDNEISRAEFVAILVKAFHLEGQSNSVFPDTAEHWAKDYISIAAASNIVKGYSDTSFGPDDAITREQMAVMVVNAAELNSVTDAESFTDQKEISSWAKDAIDTTSSKGIITGYPDKSFKPRGNAKRAEAVTVIARALEI